MQPKFRLTRLTALILFAILFSLVACQEIGLGTNSVTSHKIYGDIPTGYITFEHDGIEREYALHVPETVTENAPLLLSMHGYTDDAISHRDYTELNQVADKNNFIVAYPRGTLDGNWMRFFNIGYFFHKEETVDDVGFLSELTLYLQKKYNTDPERTFTAGFSNGADISYMLACQRPDLFKGFVSVAGLMLEDIKENCGHSIPIPVLEIHGDADDVTLYEGDINNENGWGRYPHIEETMDFWQKRNGCTTMTTDFIENPDPENDQHIEITKFQHCTDDKEVWLYKITNYGHEWPQGTDEHFFNASEEIWRFFGQY